MIAIIDYGLGNLASVANALTKLGLSYVITNEAKIISSSDAMILPGVGAAGFGMEKLNKLGLDTLIIKEAKKGKPLLGICLGMQLLFTKSEEGNVNCLDVVKGNVKKFQTKLKVPQIGWNTIKVQRSKFKVQSFGKLFKDIKNNEYCYFVNSYYCQPSDKNVIAATTDYDGDFASIVITKNIAGMQFHPEKSGDIGLMLLKNWSKLV